VVRETALPTLSDFTGALAGRLDLYLVGLFLGEAPAGIYGMAWQVRTPIRQVRQSFDSLLTPIISRTLSLAGTVRTGQATASATRLILAIQLPLLVALFIAGAPLLAWIGPEFAAGYWAMLMLAAAEAIQGAYGVSDLILLYRRPQMILWITGVGVLVNIAAGWPLILTFGVTGAAFSALLAAVASALVRRYFLRSGFGIKVSWRHGAAPLAAAAAGLAVSLPLMALPAGAPVQLAFALAAGLATYAAVLKATLHLTRESLSMTHFVIERADAD
jgi:O-antigen/teichoic acid export membrane protein